MIRSITKSLSILLITAVSFTACSKDSDDTLTVNKENLVATYTLASVSYKMTGIEETDITNDWSDACEKDDQIVFKSNMTVNYIDAGTRCSPPGDDTGTWDVSGSTLFLDSETFTIKSLSEKKLVLTLTESSGGITSTITLTLNRR